MVTSPPVAGDDEPGEWMEANMVTSDLPQGANRSGQVPTHRRVDREPGTRQAEGAIAMECGDVLREEGQDDWAGRGCGPSSWLTRVQVVWEGEGEA